MNENVHLIFCFIFLTIKNLLSFHELTFDEKNDGPITGNGSNIKIYQFHQ